MKKTLLACGLVMFAWTAALDIASADSAAAKTSDSKTVLIMLLDGARWDLLNAKTTPNLVRLAKRGVQAEMIPVWPTVSFPNHWALATGLYPLHGGIYTNGPHQEARLHGEPIWTTVTRHGGISGVVGGWGGGSRDAMQAGPGPSFSLPYRPKDNDYRHAAGLILQLLDQDEAHRPQLLAMHFMEPDMSQHLHGVGSPETRHLVEQVDAMLGDLMAGLAARGLAHEVNVIVVGDHGQTNHRASDAVYYLDDMVDQTDLVAPLSAEGLEAFAFLKPREGREDAVAQALGHAGTHVHVFRRGEIPARWHCCDFGGDALLTIATDPGSWVSEHAFKGQAVIGDHGLDNAFRDMHALFIAAGPAIKSGVTLKPFENVDVYSLMAQILNVEPAKTDGSITSLCAVLADQPHSCASQR